MIFLFEMFVSDRNDENGMIVSNRTKKIIKN